MQTGHDLPAKEIKGQRVVSYQQIAELHQVDAKSIRRNHERNKHHFVEGVDYFRIKERNAVSDNLSHTKLYFTESGYLMLVKSLSDDLSWEVQRMLVNSYFRANLLEQVLKFLPAEIRKVIMYRQMGLTQVETARLLRSTKDKIQAIEKNLSGLGYHAPSQSGKRSSFGPGRLSLRRESDQLELAL
jgi:hypothetical protein